MGIETQNITKSYGTQKVLQGISTIIKKGEITGLLGPNGAGKSTFMKILTTGLRPDSGGALVNGFDIEKESTKVQQSVGYLAESNPLYMQMYVREYLAFRASLYSVANKKVEEVIRQVGLESEAHKKIKQLSKGYKQRTGLAAALIHDPAVYILDEPVSGLDPNQLIQIRKLIKDLGKEKTVLISTHIMSEAEALCERVLIVNKGEIVADRYLKDEKTRTRQQIEVEFDQNPDSELFKVLPDLEKAAPAGKNVFNFFFKPNRDHRADIFDFASKNGIKILSLTEKTETLEIMFNKLTDKANEGRKKHN